MSDWINPDAAGHNLDPIVIDYSVPSMYRYNDGSSNWRIGQRAENKGTPKKRLPYPSETDGNAIIYNFPGPGWTGVYKTRPMNMFDLISKLHDAAYGLNGLNVQFSLGPANRSGPDQSCKAKADWMFREMNAYEGVVNPENFISHTFFDGRDTKELQTNDGYHNVLDDEYLDILSEPASYLMIPYSEIATKPLRYDNVEEYPGVRPAFRDYKLNGEYLNLYRHPDYLAEVPEDRAPMPFKEWLKNRFKSKWDLLQAQLQK